MRNIMNTEKDLQESTEQALTIPVVVPRTFTLTWKDAQKEPPKEGGRYWCVVRDIIEGISNSVSDKGSVSNYEVVWRIDHWHINGTCFTLQQLFNYCNNKIKVVGNIYETPNLCLKDSRTNHGMKNTD